jgi:SAM-dependent methyltransferase
MLAQFGKVTGTERDPELRQHARLQWPEYEIVEHALPEPLDRCYDVICMFDVLEHIGDDAAAVRWCHDHLRSQGLLFVSVPACPFLWSRHDEELHHFRRYRPSDLSRSQSDTQVAAGPGFAGSLLYGVFNLETRLLECMNFPLGVSLLGVFRKI